MPLIYYYYNVYSKLYKHYSVNRLLKYLYMSIESDIVLYVMI